MPKPTPLGEGFLFITTMEKWRLIEGYEHQYEVSNMGNVRNHIRGKNLSLVTHHTGYIKVVLYNNAKRKQFSVNVLVARAFISNPENKPESNHINGIKSDNRACNLEWVTKSENIKHAFKLGLMKSPFKGGELHNQNKLSRNDVLQIRSIHEQGWVNQKEIAQAYNVKANTINQIVNRVRWTHI